MQLSATNLFSVPALHVVLQLGTESMRKGQTNKKLAGRETWQSLSKHTNQTGSASSAQREARGLALFSLSGEASFSTSYPMK